MKNETKQTLISLSLAGAIGYYLYNKLMKVGCGTSIQSESSASTRTADELSWRPTPPVEEPFAAELEPSQPEPVTEEVITDDLFTLEQDPTIETEHNPTDVLEENPTQPVVPEQEVVSEPVADTLEEQLEIPSLALDTELPPIVSEEDRLELESEVAKDANTSDENDVIVPTPIEIPVIPTDEEPVQQADVSNMLVCPNCGFHNNPEFKFCNECGTKLTQEVPVTTIPVEEPALIVPTLDFGNNDIKLPDIEPAAIEPVAAPEPAPVTVPTEEDVSLDDLDGVEDTPVDALFDAVNEAEKKPEQEEPKTVMENTEQLHKIDQKDESNRKEFKSIMDFFAANGLA